MILRTSIKDNCASEKRRRIIEIRKTKQNDNQIARKIRTGILRERL